MKNPHTSTDNVVDISTRFSEAPPIDVRRGGWDDCGHKHTIIDEKLRTVSCADCGEERLDPIEVLLSISRQWHSWRRDANALRKLNLEYQSNQREQWERARDRHLNAHPDHRAMFNPSRGSWEGDGCRQCHKLESRHNFRWYPTPAPGAPAS